MQGHNCKLKELQLVEYLSVQEIVERIQSGMTEPYLCRLDDERLYALKGRQALPRGLIAESVCATLGRELGLPIPEFGLVQIEQHFLETAQDEQFSYSIGPGTAFASLWRDTTIPINRSWFDKIDNEVLARIYVFDHWVRNGDRTLTELGGNPNLLVDLSVNELVMIDHNLAFSAGYELVDLKSHACRKAWLDEQTNLVFNQQCQSAMAQAMADVPSLISELPEAWLNAEPDIENEIVTILARVETTQFWNELK